MIFSAAANYRKRWPAVKSDGLLVMLHDIYPERCGWLGPRYLIDTLQKINDEKSQLCFEIEERSDLDPFGIALCRKETDFSMQKLDSSGWFQRSCLAQFIEIANFEGKRTPWEIFTWGLSKWQRIARHW